jgi:hypothetical protein
MGMPFPERARTAAIIEGMVGQLVDLAFPDGRA